ncbi:hypothetical protein [Planctopirus hydrillae]|uniref:Uncharacterized protein n=1 Tax=Planctopirus hydrillae TaxID=1841610 RepID=A0A1C3EIS4_9PLAN|nr:hypothetical protein [Planctopirus hydrillae]ODA33146.1 hypothetical protein A6X21_05110 [Planctopirus hydrillae]
MKMLWIINGTAQIQGDEIAYTGTILGHLLSISIHGECQLGHAGIGTRAFVLEIIRKNRGLKEDLVPVQKYYGTNNLIDSSPFPGELVMLNENLPAPGNLVGKFTFDHMRIVAHEDFDDEGGPMQRYVVHASGMNEQGRDQTPILYDSVAIPGFELV